MMKPEFWLLLAIGNGVAVAVSLARDQPTLATFCAFGCAWALGRWYHA